MKQKNKDSILQMNSIVCKKTTDYLCYIFYIFSMNKEKLPCIINEEQSIYYPRQKKDMIAQCLKTIQKLAQNSEIPQNKELVTSQISQQKVGRDLQKQSNNIKMQEQQMTKQYKKKKQTEYEQMRQMRKKQIHRQLAIIQNLDYTINNSSINQKQVQYKQQDNPIHEQFIPLHHYNPLSSTQKSSYKLNQITQNKRVMKQKKENKEATREVEEIVNHVKKQEQKYIQYCLLQFYHYIYEVADRNDAVQANYVHFLIPYALIIKILTLHTPKDTYVHEVLRYITRKLQSNARLQKQIKNNLFQDFWIIFFKSEQEKTLLAFLAHFLSAQKQILTHILPYYYNFFALAINKERYFKRTNQTSYIDYTINFEHKQLSANEQISYQNVMKMLTNMETLLSQKYHDENK